MILTRVATDKLAFPTTNPTFIGQFAQFVRERLPAIPDLICRRQKTSYVVKKRPLVQSWRNDRSELIPKFSTSNRCENVVWTRLFLSTELWQISSHIRCVAPLRIILHGRLHVATIFVALVRICRRSLRNFSSLFVFGSNQNIHDVIVYFGNGSENCVHISGEYNISRQFFKEKYSLSDT